MSPGPARDPDPNFTRDHHSDLLAITLGSTVMYTGGPDAMSSSAPWWRGDLTTANTRIAVVDFIRRSYDAVLFYTSGAWLYAGADESLGYLIPNVYTIPDSTYGYPNAIWFGR